MRSQKNSGKYEANQCWMRFRYVYQYSIWEWVWDSLQQKDHASAERDRKDAQKDQYQRVNHNRCDLWICDESAVQIVTDMSLHKL